MYGEEGKRLRYALVFFAAVGFLILPAAAAATTRYAAPGGNATAAQCTSPVGPFCTIHEAAAGVGVQAADEVVITPGSYSDTAGDLGLGNAVTPVAGNVHGAAGQARPVVTANQPTDGPFIVNPGVTLSRIEIDTATALGNVQLEGGVVDGLIARSSRDNAIVCRHAFGTIRNSACLATGTGSWALGVIRNSFPSRTLTVRNVTAVATGGSSRGASYRFFAGQADVTVNIVNSIAKGTTMDVVAAAASLNFFCPSSVTVSLDYSDYSTASATPAGGCTSGGAGTATVTPAGTLNNQTTAPMLAADGYHQLAGSITIDNGTLASDIGTTDIDGQARTIRSAPDIGADELENATTTSVSCAPSPLTLGAAAGTCTVTVTDTGPSPNAPTGAIGLGTSAAGAFGTGCAALAIVSPSVANCMTAYTPSSVGTHQIAASYAGDPSHSPSQGMGQVLVAPSPPALCAGKNATVASTRATLSGTAGNDQINGTPAADVIDGAAGNDRIRGRGGNDTICGDGGKDRLIGGPGNDKLIGGAGKDTLKGGQGKDKLNGGPGRDVQVQ